MSKKTFVVVPIAAHQDKQAGSDIVVSLSDALVFKEWPPVFGT